MAPPVETRLFRARLFWLSAAPLRAGQDLTLYYLSARVPVTVQTIERVCDPGASDGLSVSAGVQDTVAQDSIVDVVIRARDLIALDAYDMHPPAGRFVLVDRDRVVAGGLISMKGWSTSVPAAAPKADHLPPGEGAYLAGDARRAQRPWRRGDLAHRLVRSRQVDDRARGRAPAVRARLSGLRARRRQCPDHAQRRSGLFARGPSENVRRLGAAASLFAEAGFVAIVAAISPYAADRTRARGAARAPFHEIWVKADVAVCEQRDPKGLYKLARAGEIKNFTGVAAPYEAPVFGRSRDRHDRSRGRAIGRHVDRLHHRDRGRRMIRHDGSYSDHDHLPQAQMAGPGNDACRQKRFASAAPVRL